MSRFHFSEDDDYEANDYDDDDDLFEDEQEELLDQMYMLYPQHPSNQYLQIAQTGLAAMELNQKMVRLSVEVAGKSLFWRWRRLGKKLDMIEKAYKKLSRLLEVRKEEKDAEL